MESRGDKVDNKVLVSNHYFKTEFDLLIVNFNMLQNWVFL